MSKQTTIKVDELDDAEHGAAWRRMPRSFSTRRRLNLSIEQFAERYRIPADMLRAWEAGTTTPDAIAEALMLAIAREPELLARALASGEARANAVTGREAAE